MSESAADVSQRVLVALRRAKARIAELEAKQRAPIAIVGMACRFPGGETPEAFWTTLAERKDMVREIPNERLIGPWPGQVPRWAGLLDDVASFDAGFFGVSAVEAEAMDPQQRLLLEVAWEALEHARMIPAELRGSKTGVFVGLTGSEYLERTERRHPDERSAYDVTGIMPSVAAGRISYSLGFEGPAVALDTACSSSLVAIHLACRELRAEGCDLALAGGVKLIASEHYLQLVALTQGLSPDGRCKAFDSRANGFVLGEGAGLVVLERLADAERHGHPILGIVRGSAINQDGRSTSLTAPNVLAQEAVLRAALEHAGVQPQDIDYIECHGTGTALGDPIEVDAIKSVFGRQSDETPLWLGACKTNIGHLEAAAGVAGLIKVLLAFHHRQIPANLHLRHLNPRIKLTKPLKLAADLVDWNPRTERRRMAGVSAFGMSGTNAHLIVEEPPTRSSEAGGSPRHPPAVLPVLLSARSEQALEGQAQRLLEYIDAHPEVETLDLAFSLATTRSQFEQRACIVAPDLRSALEDLGSGGRLGRALVGTARSTAKLGMLFTGQGAQRLAMGKAIHAAFPGFQAAFDEVSALFDQHLERRLIDVVFASEGSADADLLDQTAYTQPALFALQVALHRLLGSWGVTASALLGHSIGELAAAHVAGVFSLADGCRLVAARGRLMQALPTGGAMCSIQAPEAELRPLLAEFPGVDIAGFNGPLSIVVSGDEAPTLALAEQMRARGRKVKRLVVSHAFHSQRMNPMLAEFEAIARTIQFAAPQIPIIANVSGRLATPAELCEPSYWVRQVREPVRFLDGVRTLEGLGANVFLELGPHGVLTAMASACVSENAAITMVPALRRDGEVEALFSALGSLHCHGIAVDWRAVFAPHSPRSINLPTHAYRRVRHWLEVSERPTSSKHPLGLLGERLASPLESVQFRVELDPRRRALQTLATPGRLHPAIVLSMALRASEELRAADPVELRVRFEGDLALAEGETTTVQLVVDPRAGEPSKYGLHVEEPHGSNRWRSLAHGILAGADSDLPIEHEPASAEFDRAVRLQPRPADFDDYPIHPALFDAILDLALQPDSESRAPIRHRVLGCDRIRLFERLPAELELRVSCFDPPGEDGSRRLDCVLRSREGAVLGELIGLRVQNLGPVELPDAPIVDVEGRIREIVEQTLSVTPGLDNDIGRDYGADSLSLIAFMAAMQKQFGVSLRQIFNSQSFSVRSLAAVVRGEVSTTEDMNVAFTRPTESGQLQVRKAEAEPLPEAYGLPSSTTTWLCSVSDDIELELVEFGAGEPIIFLPPFNSEWPVWSPVMTRMAANHRVIAVNYPGLGRSHGAAGLREVAQLAAWLCWAFDALGLSATTLVGWSLGGFFAQKIASARPDLVARTVLVNTTAKLETSETAAGASHMVSALHAHLDEDLATMPDDERQLVESLVYHGQAQRNLEFGYYKMLTNWDFREQLSTIVQPTLIVSGAKDPLTPPGHSEEIQRSIPNGELVILDAGHYVPIFATEVLVAHLRRFIGSGQH